MAGIWIQGIPTCKVHRAPLPQWAGHTYLCLLLYLWHSTPQGKLGAESGLLRDILTPPSLPNSSPPWYTCLCHSLLLPEKETGASKSKQYYHFKHWQQSSSSFKRLVLRVETGFECRRIPSVEHVYRRKRWLMLRKNLQLSIAGGCVCLWCPLHFFTQFFP